MTFEQYLLALRSGKPGETGMDKYESLERKLRAIKKCLGELNIYDDATKLYVVNYGRYVDDLIELVHNREIHNSNGALLGLGRGLSDYDELCSHDALLEAAYEADNYYSKVCVTFN